MMPWTSELRKLSEPAFMISRWMPTTAGVRRRCRRRRSPCGSCWPRRSHDQVLRARRDSWPAVAWCPWAGSSRRSRRTGCCSAADARIQPDALDDLARVEAVRGGERVEFVEVGDAHGQVGVGEQFDRLGFGAAGQQDRNVVLRWPPRRSRSANARPAATFRRRRSATGGDCRGGPALAQELGGEDDPIGAQLRPEAPREADRNGGLDDGRRRGGDRDDIADDLLDRGGVEIVRRRVVVGRGGDDDEVRTLVGRGPSLVSLMSSGPAASRASMSGSSMGLWPRPRSSSRLSSMS
jgi:hypothetical protein